MFLQAFPQELHNDLQKVLQILSKAAFGNISIACSEDYVEYKLAGGCIQFPYRLYLSEPDEERVCCLSENQKLILSCMYTRSNNGFIREKYVKKILDTDFPYWCIPYIVKLCDEYVAEILEVIYESLKERSNSDIQEFCRNNSQLTQRGYARMNSYWNEYYRGIQFQKYIGRKLFRECLGYSRLYEKSLSQNKEQKTHN